MLKLNINNIELTLEEAKELHRELSELFNDKKPIIPQPMMKPEREQLGIMPKFWPVYQPTVSNEQ